MHTDNSSSLRGRPLPTLADDAPRFLLAAADNGETREHTVQSPVTIIGGRRDCNLPLTHPEVSKVHCALIHTGDRLFVCDLRSRSGTFVNDESIQMRELTQGDRLRVGPLDVCVGFPESSPMPESPIDLATPFVLSGEGRHTIRQAAAVIGRRSTCDVPVDTPDVSLAHALLLFPRGCPAIYDLGSRSGTYVNGERVQFMWLCDQDKLNIGGCELTVEWQGPVGVQFAPKPAAAVDAPVLNLAAAAPPADGATVPSMGDLEQVERTIAALRATLSASRSALDTRAADVAQREAEIEAKQSEIQRREEEIVRLKETFESERSEFIRRESEIEDRRRVVTASEAKLQVQLKRLEEEQAALTVTRVSLEQDRVALEAQREALAEQLAEYEDAAAFVERREAELDRMHQTLVERERAIEQRETALAAREQQDAAAATRMNQFKTALLEVAQLFAGQTPAGGDGATPAASTSAKTAEDHAFPAPLVRTPIFAGAEPILAAERGKEHARNGKRIPTHDVLAALIDNA